MDQENGITILYPGQAGGQVLNVMVILQAILAVSGIYLSLHMIYYMILVLANFLIKEEELPSLPPRTRFAVLIPAHNEEVLLPRLLKSISVQDYPRELFQVFVIADNCTDSTAAAARSHGAQALERNDLVNRGKGFALKWALEQIEMDSFDAAFIVDADSITKKNILRQLDRNVSAGRDIIQCYNGIENPGDSWFTRLLEVSRAVSNMVYHPAKEKLGLSSSLMGNGMCFSRKALAKYGWDAFSVGEDWEFYSKLMHKGEVIHFDVNARVYHRESSTLKQATSQRLRWSSGRFAVLWKYGISLLLKGMAELNIRKVESSFPLVFPNPSLGLNITIFFLCASAFLPAGAGKWGFTAWFASLLALQFLIFLIGVFYTERKLLNLLTIFIAPIFLGWKMAIDVFSVLGGGRKNWVRTKRHLIEKPDGDTAKN